MIVDAHTHIFPPEICASRERYCARDDWFDHLYQDPKARMATAEDLIEMMDLDGIDRAVACGFAWSDQGLCREHNEYLIDAVARYPDRLIGMAIVQPRAGRSAQRELERCLDAGLRGLGELMPDGQGFALDDAGQMAPLVDVLQERGWPLMTHVSEPVGHHYGGKGRTWPRLVFALAERFPDLRIVCGHWGGGLPFYELMPEVAQILRHVYYDSAASPYLYRWWIFPLAIQMVGPRKILMGSDFPLIRSRSYLLHLKELPLDKEDRGAILGGNAAALWLREELVAA